MNTGMVVSSWSNKSLEDIAIASPNGPKWLQVVIYKDRKMLTDLIRRAERAGYKGIFVTVDSVVTGKKYHVARNSSGLPKPYR